MTAAIRLRSVTRRIADDGPLLALAPNPSAVFWLHGLDGFVAWGEVARFDVPADAGRGAATQRWFDALCADAEITDEVGVVGTGPVLFASMTFTPTTAGSVAVVPAVVVGRRGGITFETRVERIDATAGGRSPGEVTHVPVAPRLDRVRYAGSTQPDLHYLAAVADVIERIEAGEIDKVVLARDHRVWSHETFDARDLGARLYGRFPSCFTFHVDGLVGATPELLTRVVAGTVVSEVLAGTTPTSPDLERDRHLGEALLANDKDLREHAFAADSAHDVLRELTDDLTRRGPTLRRLDNVQHLATRIEGQLTERRGALSVAELLHPTAAVGGTPRRAALDVIADREGMSRGRYAAPVGWMDRNGDGEFGIALRCAEIDGTRARLFAGAGIVAGSLPEDELEETRLKLRAMQSAFA